MIKKICLTISVILICLVSNSFARQNIANLSDSRLASMSLPQFSDSNAEKWYFVQFLNGTKVISDCGIGECVLTANSEPDDAQLWKLTGDKDNFQLVNQLGHYLVVSNKVETNTGAAKNPNPLRTSENPYAAGFSLVESKNKTYSPAWEIQPNDFNGKCFNQWGGAGLGKTIGIWDATDDNNPLVFIDPESMDFPEFMSSGIKGYVPANDLTLWYDIPSTVALTFPAGNGYGTWMEYALPIGDGQLGASVMGGIKKDEIIFNDKSLWSGSPSIYGKYEVFGRLMARYIGDDLGYAANKQAKDYLRQLDLTTATAKVSFKNNAGVKYNREYIASNPARVIAVRYSAEQSGKINLLFTLESAKGVKATTNYADDEASFSGKLETVSYNARIKVVKTGGSIKTTSEGIEIHNADEVIVYLAAGTDYEFSDKSYVSNTASLADTIQSRVNKASLKKWNELYKEHVTDFQYFFNRVDFNLGNTQNNKPTNELIDAYDKGRGADALMLEKLYFAYGRYLEIASSRGAALPSNLQGIWNGLDNPAWNSDIHSNINVQMNYWPAEPANLSEMHMPFLDYIVNMASSEQWKKNAADSGQKEGWTCFTENNIFGGGGDFMHNYVIANAWYCTHLWQHYRYTLDKAYLKRVFPAMWTASRFWIERLVKAGDGTYECPQEYSPEHGPKGQNGVAHAQQLVWDLLNNTSQAAYILGDEAGADPELLAIHRDRLQHLDKGLRTETYNGNWGSAISKGDKLLREWKYSPYTAGERGHRHMSHLMCIYPFSQVHPGTELFDAAVNSLKLRGDGATGWSMGWKINLWARAFDGDHARKILTNALTHANASSGIYYNLFDAHDPFQIDGNFGACAGIAEMIMQSNSDTIRILPALPTAWKNGHMKGLKAVGNFTVDITWENAKPTLVKVISNKGQDLLLHYPGIAAQKVKADDAEVEAEKIDENTIKLKTKEKQVITIDFTSGTSGIASASDDGSLKFSVNGRHVTVNGATSVIVSNLSGNVVHTSDKSSFEIPQSAGNIVILKAKDKTGTFSCHKVVMKH